MAATSKNIGRDLAKSMDKATTIKKGGGKKPKRTRKPKRK
jgi:hypothetical protein